MGLFTHQNDHKHEPYFFGNETLFFQYKTTPKNLDLSSKTVLDLWDCLGGVKVVL